MRILLVSPSYYPHIGGVEYVVKSIAERLSRLGHKVTVLCGEPKINRVTYEKLNDVLIIKWPTISPNNAYHIPKYRIEFRKTLKELASIHDIAHIHGSHAVLPVEAGLKLKYFNPGIKLIFTLHYHGTGHTLLRKVLWNIIWKNKVSLLVDIADKIHTVSRYEAQLIKNHYRNVKNKLIIIPNGVDKDVFRYRWKGQNSHYIIYAGRIEKYKKIELAINIAKNLGLEMVILGNGSYKERLMRYAHKYYPQKVRFYRPQPRYKYLDLLSNAKYAINLSEHEAFSLFIAEALAMGVPSIVSENIRINIDVKPSLYIEGYPLLTKAPLKSWENIVSEYLTKLYINGVTK